MKTYVIDRIISGIAVCECLESNEIIEIATPKGAKEGDVIRKTKNGFVVDEKSTQSRRKNMQDRLQKLFEQS